jgi:hypothetical protein
MMNAMWSPESRAGIPLEFSKIFDIPENDKTAVLGLTQPSSENYELPANKSTTEKMQGFLSTAQEHCCHVLASACDSMGHEFFVCHPFIEHLVQSVALLLCHAPNNRLRPVIRVFMKSLVLRCPADCYDHVLLPVLHCLSDFMLQRLSLAWDAVNRRMETTASLPATKGHDPHSQLAFVDQEETNCGTPLNLNTDVSRTTFGVQATIPGEIVGLFPVSMAVPQQLPLCPASCCKG